MAQPAGCYGAANDIVHGDLHPQQLFFASGRSGRFAVLDWQTAQLNTGAVDPSRLIAMGLTNELRVAHEERLTDLYYGLLIDHGVSLYTRKQLDDDMRWGLLASVITNVLGAVSAGQATLDAYQARGVDLLDVALVRLAAAVEARDAAGVLKGSRTRGAARSSFRPVVRCGEALSAARSAPAAIGPAGRHLLLRAPRGRATQTTIGSRSGRAASPSISAHAASTVASRSPSTFVTT
ncbi:MAG: DUF1679 domain-containing protein [Chloroflexi bacterium]|nr:DUF1679 domain-containing protein [Chloroflexota bacterium]MDA1003070.1 DUF1679 domain-containing protein [Chloroflexota bacterium]MQC27816.1 DUF1679 domain-containing protein [Chloroflexota bacterium]